MPFSVIPVLDLKDGKAVHAIAGRRDHYQPIRSILHASSEPIALARAIRDTLGLHTLYLADLDAIGGWPPNLRIYQQIIALGICIYGLMSGVRDVISVAPLLELGRCWLYDRRRPRDRARSVSSWPESWTWRVRSGSSSASTCLTAGR